MLICRQATPLLFLVEKYVKCKKLLTAVNRCEEAVRSAARSDHPKAPQLPVLSDPSCLYPVRICHWFSTVARRRHCLHWSSWSSLTTSRGRSPALEDVQTVNKEPLLVHSGLMLSDKKGGISHALLKYVPKQCSSITYHDVVYNVRIYIYIYMYFLYISLCRSSHCQHRMFEHVRIGDILRLALCIFVSLFFVSIALRSLSSRA